MSTTLRSRSSVGGRFGVTTHTRRMVADELTAIAQELAAKRDLLGEGDDWYPGLTEAVMHVLARASEIHHLHREEV